MDEVDRSGQDTAGTGAEGGLRFLDLTYAVEPLAKLIYHAGACGEVNGKNSMELSLAKSQPWEPDLSVQPTADQSGEYFVNSFPVASQEVYRELATGALEGVHPQLTEAVRIAAAREVNQEVIRQLATQEWWYQDKADGLRSRWRLWRRPAVRAFSEMSEIVRDLRLDLERPREQRGVSLP